MPRTRGNPLSWRKRAWEKRKVVAPEGGYRRSTSAILRAPPPLPVPTDRQRAILLSVLLGRPCDRGGRNVAKPWGCSSLEEAAVLALQVGYIELPFEVDP